MRRGLQVPYWRQIQPDYRPPGMVQGQTQATLRVCTTHGGDDDIPDADDAVGENLP